jgi:hypothetical protein
MKQEQFNRQDPQAQLKAIDAQLARVKKMTRLLVPVMTAFVLVTCLVVIKAAG